jgi:hypothetical protein
MYKNTSQQSMSAPERVARITLGTAMISPLFAPDLNQVGVLALPALASVYPILTGLFGADPVRALLKRPLAYRLFTATAGTALIGTVYLLPAIEPGSSLGILALLPLAGAYAILAALFGRAPLAAAAEATHDVVRIVPPAAEDDAEPAGTKTRARHAA